MSNMIKIGVGKRQGNFEKRWLLSVYAFIESGLITTLARWAAQLANVQDGLSGDSQKELLFLLSSLETVLIASPFFTHSELLVRELALLLRYVYVLEQGEASFSYPRRSVSKVNPTPCGG